MAEGTQFIGDELPVFDGINGYWWSILACRFWDARGTPEGQRLVEVPSAFSGRSSIWFRLWRQRNPLADWDSFDLAFLHQFQPDMRPILPEICCKEVEDWEIEWEEFKARLNLTHQQQQSQSQIKKICESESSTKQEFASPSPEIQERKEEEAGLDADQNSTKKSTTNSTEPTTTNSDTNQEGEEEMEITTKPVEVEAMPCSAVVKKVLNSIASSEEEPPPFLDSSGSGLSVKVGGTEDGAFTVGEGESDGSGGSPLGREKQIAQGRRLRFGERNDGGGGSNHHCRVLSIFARPPDLLAVAFPWNRDIEMAGRSLFLAREMMPRAPTTLLTEGPLMAVAADAIMLLSMAHGCCSTWRKMEDAVWTSWVCSKRNDVRARKLCGFSPLLGLTQNFKAQIRMKNVCGLSKFALFPKCVDGLRFYQWDPGGTFIFTCSRIKIMVLELLVF